MKKESSLSATSLSDRKTRSAAVVESIDSKSARALKKVSSSDRLIH